MIYLLTILLSCTLAPAAEPEKPTPLRYVRPAGDGKWVLESEVTESRDGDNNVYVSRTEHDKEKLTLTVRSDLKGKLLSAEVVVETPQGKKTATLMPQGNGKWVLKRGNLSEFFDLPADPVVTSAPDWSDIFQLVRRYDSAKGGKQEFNGLWFHPVNGMLTQAFTIERHDSETVKDRDMELKLARYRVRLRSGEYHVWADKTGRVLKLQPVGAKTMPVVLEGYEDVTRELGSKQ